MLFPSRDKEMLEIFRCPRCEDIYMRGRGDFSCAVAHAPGECCHYTDKKLTIKQWSAIKDAVKKVSEE